ncbi:MAG: LysM peptidoglycan-binding domain-containing protein [Sphingomonadales bacterium]|jgi:nucleoid-associated protein YgaU
MNYESKPVLSARRLLWPGLTILAILILILVYWLRDDQQVDVADSTVSTPEATTESPDADQSEAEAEVDSIAPSFDIVRLSPSGAGVVAGRAAPRSEVILYADGQEVARAIAGPSGEWVMILDKPLPAGPTEFSLESQSGENDPVISSDIVVVVVPELDGAAAGEGVLAVLSPRDGTGVSRALQVPANGLGQDTASSLRIESIDLAEDGNATVSGRAEAEQDMRIYLNNNFVGEIKADEDGRWSLPLGMLNSESGDEVLLRVDQVISEGQVVLRIEQKFDPKTGQRFGRLERAVEVQPGNNLWAIARRIYGSGWRYAFIFQANAAQIRDPNLIYPGQVFALPNDEGDAQ